MYIHITICMYTLKYVAYKIIDRFCLDSRHEFSIVYNSFMVDCIFQMHPVPEIVEIFVVERKKYRFMLERKFLLHFLLLLFATFIIFLSHYAEIFRRLDSQ